MPTCRLFLVVSLLLLGAAPALADEDGESLFDVEVHGFVSQGAIKTIRNNFLVPNSKRGSFDLTEAGINFTKPVSDRLRLGFQLFGGGFVPTGAYNAKLDWFYLDYHWKDWLGIRAGRVKLPFGLYNEINDVDSARVPALLPQSTYPVANRNFLLAQTGFEIYGYLGSERAGALEYRLYGGTIVFDLAPQQSGLPYVVRGVDFAYLAGGRLMWELPVEGLRLGGSAQVLRLDADLQGTTDPRFTGHIEIPAVLWMGSLEYSAHDWLLAAEYGRWHSKRESNIMAPPPLGTGLAAAPWTANERYYALVAYRFTPHFQLGSYYAGFFPNVDKRHGRENQQHDVAGTLRIDITPNWLLKLEGHYLKGTAYLSAALNDRPIQYLSSRWALFMLKTTAYF
ncbi:MAG TPA: hypothetical protein VN914_05770 [Polyangia bacterium]|nr:hypothetical protein [Polyangia bacterium]